MILRLSKLQKSNKEVLQIRFAEKLQDRYKKVNRVLHYQKLFFMLKFIQTKPIRQYHINFLTNNFDIDKIKKLIGQKYY